MRQRDALTPDQERELEAIDRALAGEPVHFELRELEELVRDIRATAPEMSPGFAARLEHEVAEGFPQPREQPPRLRRPERRWVLLPAAGSLAAVIVALVVVLGSDTTSTTAPDGKAETAARTDQSSDSAAARDEAAPAGSPAAPDVAGSGGASASSASPTPSRAAMPAPVAPAAPAARAQSVAPQVARRSVERGASLVLQTPADRFDATTAAISAKVAQFGGIVASSQVGTSDASGGEATFDLRIPTDRLDRALAALATLGRVTERTQSLVDITGSYNSARERLADARAERRGLLRALARATKQAQIDSLKAQLRAVRGQINGLEGAVASLRRRADLATVSVTVRGSGDDTGGAGGGGHWTPGDAAGNALRVLEVIAGVALIALAVLLPAGLLAGTVLAAVHLGRRRRREAALDPS